MVGARDKGDKLRSPRECVNACPTSSVENVGGQSSPSAIALGVHRGPLAPRVIGPRLARELPGAPSYRASMSRDRTYLSVPRVYLDIDTAYARGPVRPIR